MKRKRSEEAVSEAQFDSENLLVTEVLRDLVLKAKKKLAAEKYVQQLTEVLLNLPADIDKELTDQEWVKEAGLQVPFTQHPYEVKGRFLFMPPNAVTSIGSFPHGLSVTPHVDLALQIPKASLQAKDHLNQRYLRKRALYLVAVAKHLTKCPLVAELNFTYHHGNHLKPLLVITPQGNVGKWLRVYVHTRIEAGLFKPGRFHPAHSNIRSAWYQGNDSTSESATPHYNQAMLQDLVAAGAGEEYGRQLGAESVRHAVLLLKQWLTLRNLHTGHGCFSGYIMTQYVLFLLQCGKLSAKMSAGQILRITLDNLSKSDWVTSPPSLASPSESAPTLQDFQQHFQVVFVDSSGSINLCADMNVETYTMVRHEASLALPLLHSVSIDSFSTLLQQPLGFYEKYDQALSIRRLGELEESVEVLGCVTELMDRGGDVVGTVLPHILRLVRRAVGHRIVAMATRPQPAHTQQWSVTEEAASGLNDPDITIGFLCNPDTCTSIVDKGPIYNSPQEGEWREFWGELSELRRFKDSVTQEAVVWRAGSLAERRAVLTRAARYIIHKHCGVSRNSLQGIGSQLDPLLPGQGTGEEQHTAVMESFEKLSRHLRKLSKLPLTITSVQGLSPVFRGTQVFPAEGSKMPQPVYEVLCTLEASGKWPEDVEAVQHLKAALRIQIATQLQPHYTIAMYPHYMDVQQEGYVFRVDVGYSHEVQLLRVSTAQDGTSKLSDTDASKALHQRLVALPKHTSHIHALSEQFSSYGPATCLAKRWLRAQLLCEHYVTDEALELIMAAVFLHPAPYTVPRSPLTGFLRFLHLLAHHDWKTTPLIVNFNNTLEKEEVKEIERQFSKQRPTLPALFIATPDDKLTSRWSRRCPSHMILSRARLLASCALKQLHDKLDDTSATVATFQVVFRPPLDGYDLLLELQPQHAQYAAAFVQQLRETFEEYALFFHDPYGGGQYIAVLWKPQTNMPFTMSDVCGRKAEVSEDGSTTHLCLHHQDIIADMKLMGKGLILNVTKPAKS